MIAQKDRAKGQCTKTKENPAPKRPGLRKRKGTGETPAPLLGSPKRSELEREGHAQVSNSVAANFGDTTGDGCATTHRVGSADAGFVSCATVTLTCGYGQVAQRVGG
ncbi:MAG: hypothetical protein VX083_03675, partial [Pseudomonadota bacterium]|nr:hypothetical protein [Pseudomonadota bacterium]